MQATQLSAATTRLIGDWTIAGVIQQVTRLSELEIRSGRSGDTVVIDCSGIDQIDLSGFQLLYVWLHCMQLSGLHPELVNMPEWMREAQQRQGIAQVFENELQERGFV
jgi:ABC-type transporter Mla MlaB component